MEMLQNAVSELPAHWDTSLHFIARTKKAQDGMFQYTLKPTVTSLEDMQNQVSAVTYWLTGLSHDPVGTARKKNNFEIVYNGNVVWKP